MKPSIIDSEKGRRFEFGKNWQRFLATITDERIKIVESSFQEMLTIDSLRGKTFLDVGSGSGMFSLAARNLGARVRSFDIDPLSVACAEELRSRYFPNDPDWKVTKGNILDEQFVKSLATYDVVYSWGVLHHTGDMWRALEIAASLVNEKGILFVAIYNDQGKISTFWKKVKELYCSGILGRTAVCVIFLPCFSILTLLSCMVKKENILTHYKKNRGMSIFHDWLDWLGGFPFEVATIDEISSFFTGRGFRINHIKMAKGSGNNQFVFERCSE